MTNSLTLDISKQLKSSDLQVSGAWLIAKEPLHKGDTAHIRANVVLADHVRDFAVRLLVFDNEWQCAFASPFEFIENISQLTYCVNFYFLINLKPSQYLATFEFIRKNDLAANLDEAENLLGRYNSFIEFSIHTSPREQGSGSGIGQQGYIHQTSTTSIYPLSTDLKTVAAVNGVEAVLKMPWPQLGEQISVNDLSATLKEMSSRAASSAQPQSTDPSPFTPNSYDRKFLAAQLPMSSKIGIVDGSGLKSNGSAGFLLFGPYLSVLPGRYEVIFKCRTGAVSAGNAAAFDVVARRGALLLAKGTPVLLEGQDVVVRLKFQVEPPGLVDLELRMSVTTGTDIFVDSVTVKSRLNDSAKSTTKIQRLVSASLFTADMQENLLQRGSETLKRENESSLVVIFIPNRVFTICGLIIAHHLQKKSNSRIILVSEGGFNEAINSSIMSLCGIEKCVLLANSSQELSDLSVDTVITHAENSLQQTKTLLKQLSKVNPDIDLQAYGDGFRNAASPQKLMAFHPISKLYFLGMPNFSVHGKVDIEIEVVDFQTSQRILTRFARAHNFQGYEPIEKYEKYSIFCLRYWGLHGYNFSYDQVADSWFQTIVDYTPKDELIIIKGGGGHVVNNQGYTKLKGLLAENGYIFMDADEYLTSCGMPEDSSKFSLEYLLYFGMFQKVTRFFSLDSSVPIILAQLDYVPRPVEIVCGAKHTQGFEDCSGFNVIATNLNQLKKSFASAPFFEPFKIVDDGSTCFTIKLI